MRETIPNDPDASTRCRCGHLLAMHHVVDGANWACQRVGCTCRRFDLPLAPARGGRMHIDAHGIEDGGKEIAARLALHLATHPNDADAILRELAHLPQSEMMRGLVLRNNRPFTESIAIAIVELLMRAGLLRAVFGTWQEPRLPSPAIDKPAKLPEAAIDVAASPARPKRARKKAAKR